jgi:hypothetical protein
MSATTRNQYLYTLTHVLLKTILLLLLYLPNTLLYFIVKKDYISLSENIPEGIYTRDLHTGSTHGGEAPL